MNPEDKQTLASLHALGLLTEDERADFLRLYATDPGFAQLSHEMDAAASTLALTLPQSAPPADLRSAILEKIRTSRQDGLDVDQATIAHAAAAAAAGQEDPPVAHDFLKPEPGPFPEEDLQPLTIRGRILRFPSLPWAVAAALAIVSIFLAYHAIRITNKNYQLLTQNADASEKIRTLRAGNESLNSRLKTSEAERKRLVRHVAELESQILDAETKLATVQTSNPLTDVTPVTLTAQNKSLPAQSLTALWDPAANTGLLNLSTLPPAPAGKDYQLWIITPDNPTPISAGIIKPATGTSPRHFFKPATPVTRVAALAISLEPLKGSAIPQGPVIYVGKP